MIESYVAEAARAGRDFYMSDPKEMKMLLALAVKCEELEPRIKRLRLKCTESVIRDELQAISKELQILIDSLLVPQNKGDYADKDDK